MKTDSLILHSLVGFLAVIFAIHAYGVFSRRRTKINLAMLLLPMFLLVGTVISFFYSLSLKSNPYDLLLPLVLGACSLWYVQRANAIYYYRRTKYNLAQLIVSLLWFVVVVLSYVYPGWLKYVGPPAVFLPLAVTALVVFVLFLFYPEINRYLSRRKTGQR